MGLWVPNIWSRYVDIGSRDKWRPKMALTHFNWLALFGVMLQPIPWQLVPCGRLILVVVGCFGFWLFVLVVFYAYCPYGLA